jgi:hypothetical protein
MNVELDEVIRAGAVTVAALVNCSVHCGFMLTVSIHGSKRPIAVLIRRDDVTMAFEIDGPQISLDDLEQRFPGRCSEFERLAITSLEKSH